MARNVDEILAEMISAKNSKPELSGLNSNSTTAIWRLLFYIVALAHNILERIFDDHKTEVLELLSKMKPHKKQWYEEKAKAFSFGYDLVPDSDEFDYGTDGEELIAASKIIAFAAATETIDGLFIKVAKLDNEDLTSLSVTEVAVFEFYMNKIKDAGVKLVITSGTAELLKLALEIYYDPLILNAVGSRLDGSDDTPVLNAIKSYLKNIEFNGTLMIHSLIDTLQNVEGITIPTCQNSAYRYGELDWIPFSVYHRPHSGYIRLSEIDLTITYLPNSYIS